MITRSDWLLGGVVLSSFPPCVPSESLSQWCQQFVFCTSEAEAPATIAMRYDWPENLQAQKPFLPPAFGVKGHRRDFPARRVVPGVLPSFSSVFVV